MMCSIDLQNDLNNRPVARQLLHSLVQYMNSDLFNPQDVIESDVIKELFERKQKKSPREDDKR